MTSSNSSEKRSSSYDQDLYNVVHSGQGVPIQCQFCPATGFRRSRLRSEDVSQLLRMRYPVRCLRCSQRQMVSFTVAGISIPSHVKQRRAKQIFAEQKHWVEPGKKAAEPEQADEQDLD
jgi:hypothetical protein